MAKSRGRKAKTWKGRLKHWYTTARGGFVNRFLGFGPDDLVETLRRLGVRESDVLLAHVAYNRFEGFRGTPVQVVESLQRLVGSQGTLLMPTLPFGGSAVDYARSGEITDMADTPSAMGLVTEIFRRSPDVIRSVHPTHCTAAWGARAAELVRDHHLATTPCGVNSPYRKLLDCDGQIAMIGARFRALTFYHAVEEILEPRMPVSPFTQEVFDLQTRDPQGVLWPTQTRLFNRELGKRRDLDRLIPVLKASGHWHEARIGLLPVIVLRARQIFEACQELADRGVFCYRDA